MIFLPFKSVWKDTVSLPCIYKVFHHCYFRPLSIKDLRWQLCTIWEANWFGLRLKGTNAQIKSLSLEIFRNLTPCFHGAEASLLSHHELCGGGRRGDGKAVHSEKHKLFATFPHWTRAFLKSHFSILVLNLDIVYLSTVSVSNYRKIPLTTICSKTF